MKPTPPPPLITVVYGSVCAHLDYSTKYLLPPTNRVTLPTKTKDLLKVVAGSR
uniref:Uncharacterized protein n=1 Tax=Solanum tuberosum TaxID=4113 RepID=M1BC73_SOLTU